jgi:hypothetical protein
MLGGVKQTSKLKLSLLLVTDTVEKVESLTSLQICQNTNDIFD